MYKRAARYTKYSKPHPAARGSTRLEKERTLSRLEVERLAQLRKSWFPYLEAVAKTGRPLRHFTDKALPRELRLEVLKLGLDEWLRNHSAEQQKSRRKKMKE
jgi:hypothetical protein